MGDPKSMEDIQKDLINKFDCNPDWPICMFDFTYKNKVPNHFCFKVEANLSIYIQDNYFDSANPPSDKKLYRLRENAENRSLQDMLIERNHHLCNLNPDVDFVRNFKTMFLNEHPIFFKCDIFNYAINDH